MMDTTEHADMVRLLSAARHATVAFPPAVGRILARELHAYVQFGYRLGDGRVMDDVVREILAVPAPDGQVPETAA